MEKADLRVLGANRDTGLSYTSFQIHKCSLASQYSTDPGSTGLASARNTIMLEMQDIRPYLYLLSQNLLP